MHSCPAPNPDCFRCQLDEDEVREFLSEYLGVPSSRLTDIPLATDYQEG